MVPRKKPALEKTPEQKRRQLAEEKRNMKAPLICNLRQIRQAKRITATQVSKILGVTKPQVSRLERGLIDPRVSQAIKLAHMLDIGVQQIWPGGHVQTLEPQ